MTNRGLTGRSSTIAVAHGPANAGSSAPDTGADRRRELQARSNSIVARVTAGSNDHV
jgi:hypothetical protein